MKEKTHTEIETICPLGKTIPDFDDEKTPAEIEKWFSKWLQKKLTGRAIIELKEIIELRRKEAEITQTGRVPKAPLNSEVAGSNPALCNNQKKESENGQLENKRSEEYGETLSRIDEATKKAHAEIEIENKWKVRLLLGFSGLFMFSGIYLLNRESASIYETGSPLQTLWSFKDLIGFIGIVFSCYMCYKAGYFKQKEDLQ